MQTGQQLRVRGKCYNLTGQLESITPQEADTTSLTGCPTGQL